MSMTRTVFPFGNYDCRTGEYTQTTFLTNAYEGATTAVSDLQHQAFQAAQANPYPRDRLFSWQGVVGNVDYNKPPKAGVVSSEQQKFLLEAWKEIECGIFYKTEEEAEQSFRENF